MVNDNYTNHDMIIGKDVLRKANVNIIAGKVTLRKRQHESTEVEENFINQIDVIGLVNEEDDYSHINNDKVREEVKYMINNYSPVKPEKSCIEMKIDLEDDVAVHQNPRRLATCERKIVADQVRQWLDEGIIVESKSQYSSPIVLVKKKYGNRRLCIDFRKLNEKVIKDRYPLPLIEDVLENLYYATIFTALDLKNGFFHVDIEQNSQKFTSFVTPDGQYEFKKVPLILRQCFKDLSTQFSRI